MSPEIWDPQESTERIPIYIYIYYKWRPCRFFWQRFHNVMPWCPKNEAIMSSINAWKPSPAVCRVRLGVLFVGFERCSKHLKAPKKIRCQSSVVISYVKVAHLCYSRLMLAIRHEHANISARSPQLPAETAARNRSQLEDIGELKKSSKKFQ